MEHYAEEELPAGALPRNAHMPVLWDNPWLMNRTARPNTTLAGKLFIKVMRAAEVCGECSNLQLGGGFSCSESGGSISSRLYLSMELDGYSKESPMTRSLVGEWGATISLDVVEYYGPSAVQAALWESRIWGQDQLLGRFSFPLSDGVVVCGSESVSPPDPQPCRCRHQASTQLPAKRPFPSRASDPTLAPSTASMPPPATAASPMVGCCLPWSRFSFRRRSSRSSSTIQPEPTPYDLASPCPTPPPVPGDAGQTAEQLLENELRALRAFPASRMEWHILKPVGRGPRIAFLLDIQYLPLKTCMCLNKEMGMNELQRAALLGKTDVVEAILRDAGWSSACTQRTTSGYTALDFAILRGDLKATHLLLENAAERFFQEVAPMTPSPLHMAVRSLSTATLSIVIQALRLVSIGIESSVLAHRDEEWRTPFALACALGHLEAAQALIKRFADPAARDLHKNTPLHLAARYGHLHVVKFLLNLRGSTSSSTTSSSSSTAAPAAANPSAAAAAMTADVLARGGNGGGAGTHLTASASPVSAALAVGSVAPRASLASMAALPCAFNTDGDTALLLAARYGHVEIARALLKKGVPAIDENKEGRTALHEAALGGHSGIIRLFVDHLLTILRRKENRRRPPAELRQAAGWLMAQDIHGKSPLSLAMANGHREVAALLVASAMEVNSLCGVRPQGASEEKACSSGERLDSGVAEDEEDYMVPFEMLNELRPVSSASSGESSSAERTVEES